jgi:hypothetical protein
LKQKAGRITVAGITMGSDAEAELLPRINCDRSAFGLGGWSLNGIGHHFAHFQLIDVEGE